MRLHSFSNLFLIYKLFSTFKTKRLYGKKYALQTKVLGGIINVDFFLYFIIVTRTSMSVKLSTYQLISFNNVQYEDIVIKLE